jgi:hypothetical protein
MVITPAIKAYHGAKATIFTLEICRIALVACALNGAHLMAKFRWRQNCVHSGKILLSAENLFTSWRLIHGLAFWSKNFQKHQLEV